MAKLTILQGSPANFKLPVTVQNLNGEDVTITFDCKGRTLREWHPLYAKRIASDANRVIEAQAGREDKGAKKKKDDAPLKIEFNESEVVAQMEESLKLGASLVLEVADGWDVDAPFDEENIVKLIEWFPGAHQALHAEYDARIRGNRVKN